MAEKLAELNKGDLEVYSTAEKKIGVWIDGKPLYRTSLYWHGALADDTTLTIVNSFASNVSQIIHVNGTIGSSSGTQYNPLVYLAVGGFVKPMVYTDGKVTLQSSSTGAWSDIKVNLSIEYTKTTD